MKAWFLSLLFLLICNTLQACASEEIDPDEIPDNVEFREAIIDFQGHYIVPPIFDSIGSHIYDNQFDARQKMHEHQVNGNDAYALKLDKDGKVLSKSYFPRSMNWASTYEYTNKNFRDTNYHIFNTFPDLKAQLSKENQKYGFVNSKEQWVIPPQWDLVTGFQSNPPTSFVWNYGHPFSRWGIIDQKGNYLLKPTCVALGSFENTNRPIKICRIPFNFVTNQQL